MQPERIDRRRNRCREVVAAVLDENEEIHDSLAIRSVVKCPLRPGSRLLGSNRVEILLIPVSKQKQGLQIILLNLLADHLLQCLHLQHLVGLLLSAQFDEQRLIDPLQGSHLGVLSRISGMCRRLKLAYVRLPLGRIRPDRADRLQAAGVGRIGEIYRGAVCGNDLPSLSAQRTIADDLPNARKAGRLVCSGCSIAGQGGVDPLGRIAIRICRLGEQRPLLTAEIGKRCVKRLGKIRHLPRKIVGSNYLLLGLNCGCVKLFSFQDLLHGMSRLRRIIDDARTELGACCSRAKLPGKQAIQTDAILIMFSFAVCSLVCTFSLKLFVRVVRIASLRQRILG